MFHNLESVISIKAEPRMSSIPTAVVSIIGKTWARVEATHSNQPVQQHLGQRRCKLTTRGGKWFLMGTSQLLTLKIEGLSSKLWWRRIRNWRSSRIFSVHPPKWSSITDLTASKREQVPINSSPVCSSRINSSIPSRRYLSHQMWIAQGSQSTKSSTRK